MAKEEIILEQGEKKRCSSANIWNKEIICELMRDGQISRGEKLIDNADVVSCDRVRTLILEEGSCEKRQRR